MWWPAKGGRRLCTKVAYCTYVCGVYMRTRVRKNGGEVNDRVYERIRCCRVNDCEGFLKECELSERRRLGVLAGE